MVQNSWTFFSTVWAKDFNSYPGNNDEPPTVRLNLGDEHIHDHSYNLFDPRPPEVPLTNISHDINTGLDDIQDPAQTRHTTPLTRRRGRPRKHREYAPDIMTPSTGFHTFDGADDEALRTWNVGKQIRKIPPRRGR